MRKALVLLGALAALLVSAAPASAGRLLITGHDADHHCAGGAGCHYVHVAVAYVRGGAPQPANPVLILDRGNLEMVSALNAAFPVNTVPRVVMDPRSDEFRNAPLTTDRYSAIIVASDTTCGGCDLNELDSAPDSRAINNRKGDIAAFYNAGGGIYANSGASHGNGDPDDGPDVYYDFLPIPAGGTFVTGPFCLTPIGAGLGFEDQGCPDAGRHGGENDDINCCQTHNSFSRPGGNSAFQIAEIDVASDGQISSDDVPETLIADGVATGGEILDEPVVGKAVEAGLVSGDVFIKLPGGGGGSAHASQKGTDFEPLTEDRVIPVRSILDTRQGTVAIRSARNRKGRLQSGKFAEGVFQVLQSRKRRKKGLTELRLKGSAAKFNRCGGGRLASAAAGTGTARASLTRRQIRRLRARARGRYRTGSRYSAATVRGTTWTVTDRCDGTLTTVKRGTVVVRDFRLKKNITVRAGKSYLARAAG